MMEKSKNKTKAEKAEEERKARIQHEQVLKQRYGIGRKPTHYRGK
jgi:hypothetical protein